MSISRQFENKIAIVTGSTQGLGEATARLFAERGAAGIVINPAAFTHTSVAILDALSMFDKPIIELHISNPHKREAFRHVSYVSQAATGMICGLGVNGYPLAVEAMADMLAG